MQCLHTHGSGLFSNFRTHKEEFVGRQINNQEWGSCTLVALQPKDYSINVAVQRLPHQVQVLTASMDRLYLLHYTEHRSKKKMVTCQLTLVSAPNQPGWSSCSWWIDDHYIYYHSIHAEENIERRGNHFREHTPKSKNEDCVDSIITMYAPSLTQRPRLRQMSSLGSHLPWDG